MQLDSLELRENEFKLRGRMLLNVTININLIRWSSHFNEPMFRFKMRSKFFFRLQWVKLKKNFHSSKYRCFSHKKSNKLNVHWKFNSANFIQKKKTRVKSSSNFHTANWRRSMWAMWESMEKRAKAFQHVSWDHVYWT